jgi:serine/threonine protein kinase
MGRVLRARDEELGRDVAIKVQTNTAEGSASTERFLREARLNSKIRHPNIVQVYDLGLDRGRRPFVVYELVKGCDLAQRVASPFTLTELRQWGSEICDALQAVHDAATVHRDVKPANVLVAEDGRALLADFGLAKERADRQYLTRTGAVVGTPLYLAPELWLGGTATPASDQWSWAASLYAVLYDQAPYERADLESLLRREGTPPSVTIPAARRGEFPDFEPCILRALRSAPETRFSDMATFSLALEKSTGVEPASPSTTAPTLTRTLTRIKQIPTPRPPPPESPAKPATGSGRPAWGAAALALSALIGGALVFPRSDGQPGPVLPETAEGRFEPVPLAPPHQPGDGTTSGYMAHLKMAREAFADPRVALRFRRALEALAAHGATLSEKGEAGISARERLLEHRVLPGIRH